MIILGNRCVVPATTMGDHRLETSARSRCKSIKVSQCRTLSSFINGKQSFNRQRNRFKIFSKFFKNSEKFKNFVKFVF